MQAQDYAEAAREPGLMRSGCVHEMHTALCW
jgi:hypothetical protein